ncbi:MAG: translocation/assembly module TamB domain-containing protein, partial [Bacteroidaceae bacterium]|nr:translocation/assembly module TamB domain-containing protein [Bacteroidaceae bacterium]
VGETYIADLRLQQAGGVAAVKGTFNAATENYQAKIDVRNLNLHNFLPQDSLYNITAHAEVSGQGLDFQLPLARCDGTVMIEHLRYGHNDFRNVRLNGKLRNGKGYVDFYSDNDLLQIQACAEVALDRKKVELSDFSLDASRLDLHRLGLVPKPLVASMLMHLEGSSDFVDSHCVKGRVQAIQLALRDTIVHPVDMDVEAQLLPDSLYVLAHAGDLELRATAPDSWKQVLEKVFDVTEEITRQYSEREIDPLFVRSLLPVADVHIESGPNNPMGNFLKSVYGYSFDRLHLDVITSPTLGVNGDGTLLTVNTGSVQLDTIQCRLYHDDNDDFRIFARVKNGPKNKQVVFDSNVRAQFTPSGASAQLQFFDARGVKGVDMGAVVNLEEEGMRLHLHPLQPVIAYRHFSLNDDNFVYLRRDRHLEANIDLIADDGTGFKLYTTPNETALQDITLSVHDFNVGELSDVIPYMPDVRGTLAGDFHYVQDEGSMSVSVDAQVAQMMYEGAQLGNIGLNATYLPNSDGTHYVDGIVSHNGNDVLLLTGTYNPAGQGTLDGQAELQRLPLELANGFLPDNLATLAGYVHGQLDVSGSVASPVLDGALRTDSMRLNSDLYSVHLRFPDDTIRIEKSIIDLNHLQAYSKGKSPVVLDGRIDARKTEKIGLDVSLKAHDFELINAPKTRGALAYGRVYVDIDTRLTGTLDNLKLRGSLNVLGNTNVTYVLTDSPLTVDDQLADLVTFVDFSDTTYVEPERQRSAQNIDMLVDIGIKQSAQVHCLLSADGTNYVDIEGGGDLTMKYTTRDNLQLFGRYVVTSGKMNYTLIVTALKDMEIKSGSYVEWTGDIANPRLSLQASEHVKTTVYENNVPRSVNFNVGIVVSKTLADMGLEFTLEAPEDLNITNQLTTMSSDARGKVAVTMLATGMYLAEEAGTSGFSGTNALNAFLQNQVSVISSKALKTIDMNFGIDNTNTASGSVKTDYNFSFAKRFWGNRISLIIGGKVSSGANVQNTGQSIIDNVSLEYRLDKSATRFVRLYYDRDTKSLLENEVMEMGAGVVFRKKSTRLGELFIFRKKE